VTTPAYGTADSVRPANEQQRDYTVIGFYDENGERWAEVVDAPSAREAERIALGRCAPEGKPLVAGVVYALDGKVVIGDTYAKYLDPDDPRARQENS
jgi:hypothetical protein